MPIKVLDLAWDNEGIFQARPNRFLGLVDILSPDKPNILFFKEKVHIHDPGRLNEILYPGNRVLLKHASGLEHKNRSTFWDLIAGWCNNDWVLVNSGYHRAIAETILSNKTISPFKSVEHIKPEVQIGHSRLDFLITTTDAKKIYIEVKGCTLTIDGTALFPDAPTSRGVRHVQTLLDLQSTNTKAALIILVFRSDSSCFAPNGKTDPAFATIFRTAIKHGVAVYPMVFKYKDNAIYYLKQIPVCKNID